MFDETYAHCVHNNTYQQRIIFFAGFTRPPYAGPLRWLDEFLIRYVYRSIRSRNDMTETSVVGKVTPLLLCLKKFFRGIKRRSNRKVYFTVKYLLFAGLPFLLLRSFS